MIRKVVVLVVIIGHYMVIAQQPLFENSDFSNGNLENWSVEGEAFEFAPSIAPINPGWDVTGSLNTGLEKRWDTEPQMYQQKSFSGYEGAFANSYHPKKLDRVTGKLKSVPFVINNKYICFSQAAGNYGFAGRLTINLVVDGKILRQAIPTNLNMEQRCFDVTELQGKTAKILLIDDHPHYEGWLAADQFVASDTPITEQVIGKETPIITHKKEQITLKINQRYLNIPAQKALPDDGVKLWSNGKVIEERIMAVATDATAEFWQFVDVSAYKGKELELSFEGWSGATSPLSEISQANSIKGLDNLYNETQRPQVHFSPMQGWSNDVNGAVYYDGEYHLFYQYDPSSIGEIGRNMHWGHAVSKDLFHWKELPIALGVDRKRGQIYSGSAIIDEHNVAGLQKGNEKTMVAFYTRRTPYYLLVHDYGIDNSTQCMAYSNDRGRTWTHIEKPLVENITTKNRDPKVFWHEPTKKWIMVFFTKTGFVFHGSTDLFNWEELSSVEGYKECPDIFQLDVDGDPNQKKWVLINGSGDYSVGEFDGEGFSIAYRGRTEFGPLLSTQTFAFAPEGTQSRIQMAWFQMLPNEMPFKQVMSLPMEFTLKTTKEGVRLFSNPVKTIEKLHGKTIKFDQAQLATKSIGSKAVPFELFDATFYIDVTGVKKVVFEIRGIPVEYDSATGIMAITNGKTKNWIEMPVVKPVNGVLKIRAILDRSSLDLVLNNGEVHLASEAYQDVTKPVLQLTEGAEETTLISADFTKLKSIWK